MNKPLHVLLDFVKIPDVALDEFTTNVVNGLTGNTAYPTPPVALTLVQTQQTAFTAAVAAMAQGGTLATAAKNNARETLVNSLRLLAGYVQTSCNNDLPTLLSSGFQAAQSTQPSHPLDKPSISSVENGETGQLFLNVKPVTNARAYEVRVAVSGTGGALGPWQSAGMFNSTRNLALTGLTPGTLYSIEIRAIGGSTGYSYWSDAVSHMST